MRVYPRVFNAIEERDFRNSLISSLENSPDEWAIDSTVSSRIVHTCGCWIELHTHEISGEIHVGNAESEDVFSIRDQNWSLNRALTELLKTKAKHFADKVFLYFKMATNGE